ncbi:hypothetical protein HY991_04330 [Candidatus Micrarchaeota archaeon]|nr:hypothetical protein [Candidatus Micrarchaeota archaeon]
MKRGSEWTPIYMLLVIIIAAVLIITLIKPALQYAAAQASENLGEAGTAAKGALFSLFLAVH